MMYRCLLVFAVLSLSGCALHHGRGDDPDPDPTPDPIPDPTPDCPPGGPPEPCSFITADGCLDPSDQRPAMARGCGSECPAGYGRIGEGYAICEETPEPAPMCRAGYVDEWRAYGVPEGEATVARFDVDGAEAELVLELPSGEASVHVPAEHADLFFPDEPVEVIRENVGGTSITRVIGERSEIAVITSSVGPPAEDLEIGGVRLALGELACASQSSPPECGLDRSYALDVTIEGETLTLAPGEFQMHHPLVLDGELYYLTHGGATAWAAEGCEVFAPWAFHVVVSRFYGMA